jgi:methylglyoxal synthase
MEHNAILIEQKKKIALVAHDSKKQDLLEWAEWNKALLVEHELYATGTTGMMLEQVLDTPVYRFQSGPLGGDQQIGAKIAEGAIDFMIFFWDPLDASPHDTDVKALLRIAVVWNIPVACNRASADFMISSTLMTGEYERLIPDYQPYQHRLDAAPAEEDQDKTGPASEAFEISDAGSSNVVLVESSDALGLAQGDKESPPSESPVPS